MQLARKLGFSFAKIGFIGLGNMGLPMAANLVKKGHQVFAYDIDLSRESRAKQHGITFRNQIKQVAKDAKTFIVIVPTPKDSKIVCESEDGIFKNASPDSLIIDSSTISPQVAIELTDSANKFGMTYVDAPTSGGFMGAAAGTLTFMIGAKSKDQFESLKPLLSCMGINFFNCGKSGAGQMAKLCNNMALGIEMAGVCQALNLGKSFGIDVSALANIMKVSTSRCWSIDTNTPVPGVLPGSPASNNYEGGYRTALTVKDLTLAIESAQKLGVNVNLAHNSRYFYEKIVQMGNGNKDFGILYQAMINRKV